MTTDFPQNAYNANSPYGILGNAQAATQMAPPPQPSVGRTLDATNESVLLCINLAKQINGRLNGFGPEAVSNQKGEPQEPSLHQRADMASSNASELRFMLEGILNSL